MLKKYPSWCCQICGEHIGWLGRFFTKLLPNWHKCKENEKDFYGI